MDYKGGTAENAPLASAIGGEYEVFLSFRSNDTRKGFTDILYCDLDEKGIHTFRDNEELRVGEEIRPELLQAIEGSKIFIPIFSQNYASSKWCLRELTQIVKCKRSTGQKILPIFYDVEPHDVKYQTGSYKEAFRQHEEACRQHKKGFDEKTVQEWREALREVGQLKGWELEKETGGHQGQLVKIVVKVVLSQLMKNSMDVTDNLVGIDHHIKKMERLLNVDSNDVLIVGIYGMGGLGKTTIARAIYNKLYECFDCCCFLADVREMSNQCNGLVNLQKQLISKIRKDKVPDIATVNDGIKIIESMARKKKVLIVLDDVDEGSQFSNLVRKPDWFGSGSRIIVTTRNKGVLNMIEEDKMYEPHSMGHSLALQLFSRHAFGTDFPRVKYRRLSKDIVSTTGGLPLTLEIIGSHLKRERREEHWEETLKKLRNIPDKDVQKKLRISYESLTNEEKQIFLDIACFFIGENKTLPFYMWDDHGYYPGTGIEALVLRSLVKIGDDNVFRMHDQLRDLGQEIVRQESTMNPGERSRLWRYNEALKILDDQTGTNKVEALRLKTNGIGCENSLFMRRHSFRNDKFEKLPNLRFLRVDGTNLTGDFKNLFSKLRCLQWRMCTDYYKPINFHMKNLLTLDLSHSYITENWEVWSKIEMAKNLKDLDLSFCEDLTITPALSKLVKLKRLNLRECSRLVEVRGLTGLKSLENLEMMSCISLKGLLDLSNLVMLKRLNLSGCDKLVEVRGLTDLKSLESLDMSHCISLERLSDGLERLESLRYLNASYVESLERLSDLSNLVLLEELNLCQCNKLVEVGGLTNLKSLKNLDMRQCTSLESLSDLSNLEMLKSLDLSQCGKLVEVRGLTGLKSLKNLAMSGFTSLELLDLSNLEMLEELDLFGCDKLVEVRCHTSLKSLKNLDMRGCTSLERFPDLSNSVMLERLHLSERSKLFEVGGLKGLKSLYSKGLLKIRCCSGSDSDSDNY